MGKHSQQIGGEVGGVCLEHYSLLRQATTQVHNFPTINWGFSQQLPGFESSRRLVGDVPLSL